LLKQKDIDIHAASSSKATPLHDAAAAGSTGLVQLLLLQKGASPTDSSAGYPPLHAACQGASSGQTCMPVVELLLQAAPEQLQQQVSYDLCTSLVQLHQLVGLNAADAVPNSLLSALACNDPDQSVCNSPHAVKSKCSRRAVSALAKHMCQDAMHAAPSTLKMLCCLQDAAGFTALMRLLQRGMWADARQLLAKGDCNLNAQVCTVQPYG
jgi:ankyrin repeat protein